MGFIPEGQITLWEAFQRKGKTLGLTIKAYQAFKKERPVFTNYDVTFEHRKLDFSEIVLHEGRSPFFGGHIAIDELNFLFDGRNSMSRDNREFSAQLLQQKKQGCNLEGTTHDVESLDVRIRDNHDWVINPEVYPAYPEKPVLMKLRIRNGPLQPYTRKVIGPFDIRPYLGMYDTLAIHNPFKKKRERFTLD